MNALKLGLLAVGCLVELSVGYSQTMNWSPATEGYYTTEDPERFIQADQQTFYTLCYVIDSLGEPFYQAKRYNQHLEASTHLVLRPQKRKLAAYQDSRFRGNQWRLYYRQQTPENQEALYWKGSAAATLQPNQSPKLLTTWQFPTTRLNGNYRVAQGSSDNTLLYGVLLAAPRQPAVLQIHRLDAAGELEETLTITTPQESRSMRMEDVQDVWLLADGRIYVLCKFYARASRKEERQMSMPYRYALLQIDAQGTTTWRDSLRIAPELDSTDVVSARLYSNAEQTTVYCAGTYKTPAHAGAFQWNVASTNLPQLVPYTEQLQRAQRAQKTRKISLKSYKIKDFWPLPDGSYLATAEQEYTKVYLDKLLGEQKIRKRYNALLIKWDVQGRVLWEHSLEKRQQAGGAGHALDRTYWDSFAAFVQEGEIHLFYNELPENRALLLAEQTTGEYHAPTALDFWEQTIDLNTGQALPRVLLQKASPWLIFPRRIQQLPTGDLLLPALKLGQSSHENTQRRWGLLSLEAQK
jgi:hypothetical protein